MIDQPIRGLEFPSHPPPSLSSFNEIMQIGPSAPLLEFRDRPNPRPVYLPMRMQNRGREQKEKNNNDNNNKKRRGSFPFPLTKPILPITNSKENFFGMN